MTSEISSVAPSTAVSTATNAKSTILSRAQDAVMPAVAGQLGMSTPQLQTQLQSGRSLADAAHQAGVGSEKLESTISDALHASPLGSAPSVHSLAKRVAHHVAPVAKHRHRAATGGMAATASVDTTPATAAPARAGGVGGAVNTYL